LAKLARRIEYYRIYRKDLGNLAPKLAGPIYLPFKSEGRTSSRVLLSLLISAIFSGMKKKVISSKWKELNK